MQEKQNLLLLDKRLQGLVGDYVPDDEILQEVACFFSIFSDLTRLKMLNQTTVSHQLRLLRDLGAVKYKRQGKITFYSLKNELISEMLLKGVEFLGY